MINLFAFFGFLIIWKGEKKIKKKLLVISNLQSLCVAFKTLISPHSVIMINILFSFSPLIILHDHRLACKNSNAFILACLLVTLALISHVFLYVML